MIDWIQKFLTMINTKTPIDNKITPTSNPFIPKYSLPIGTKGIDYAWVDPNFKKVYDEGYRYICGYLSNSPKKNLLKPDVEKAKQNNLSVVVVWETTEKRALEGYSAGEIDAKKALQQARDIGMPEDRPIYFALDWDFGSSDQIKINDYLRGCKSVVGLARVGAYGGYFVLQRCFDAGVITWGWQTVAWSKGKIEPRAHLYQYDTATRYVGGTSVDLNRNLKEDFGQW